MSIENLFIFYAKQQRSISACISMQSDQHFCFLLHRKYLTAISEIASFCTLASQFKSILVAYP